MDVRDSANRLVPVTRKEPLAIPLGASTFWNQGVLHVSEEENELSCAATHKRDYEYLE